MELALGMATNYHSPVGYWLGMPLKKLERWSRVAYDINKKAKETYQEIGPGL
jgi:hypothetical protein